MLCCIVGGNKFNWGVGLLIIVLLLLAACSTGVIKTTPITGSVTVDDIDTNETTDDVDDGGELGISAADYLKQQQGETDDDDEDIADEPTDDVPLCDWRETYDADQKKCLCDDDSIFCGEQGRCIPIDGCCDFNTCPGRNDFCTFNRVQADICVKQEHMNCKKIAEGERERYDGNYLISVEDIYVGNITDLTINGTEYSLAPGDDVEQDDRIIWIDEVIELPAACKESDDN